MPKLKANEREKIIEDLIANCDCWKGAEDRDILETFSDDKLITLKSNYERNAQAIAVANAAVTGFTEGNKAYRVNPQSGKWETAPIKEEEEVIERPRKKRRTERTEDEEVHNTGRRRKKEEEEEEEGKEDLRPRRE